MAEMQKVYGLRLVVEDLINTPLLLSAKAVIRDSQISPDGQTVLLIIREPVEEEKKPAPPSPMLARCTRCAAGRLLPPDVAATFDYENYMCAGCLPCKEVAWTRPKKAYQEGPAE